MKKLLYCAILTVFGAGLQAALTTNKTSAPKPTWYKFFNHQEQLTNEYNARLLEFARIHFEGYRKNVIFSSKNCLICEEVLGVLMNASVQSFLKTDDVAIADFWVAQDTVGIVLNDSYYEFVLFLAEKLNEFFKHLAKLQSMHAWNPRARHLIFTVNKPDDRELEMIFRKCWDSRMLNVAVITWNEKDAYTYNPYLNNHTEMREKVKNWSRLYYDKFRNMNGFPIRTKYTPFPGINPSKWLKDEGRYKFSGADYSLAQAFFKTVNATPAFVNLTNDFVPLYDDPIYRCNAWMDLTVDGVELWPNYMVFQIKMRVRSESAYPLRSDDIRILVPKSGVKIPNIFHPYNNIAWSCVVFSLITFALYTRVLYITRGINENAFFRTFGIFLGQDPSNRPQGRLEKVTLSLFTTYSLLILSAYQGALYSALATVTYYPEIDNVNQLRESVKIVNTHEAFMEFLKSALPPEINLLEFQRAGFVNHMTANRDEAYVFPHGIAEYVASLTPISEKGVPFFHVMKDYSFPAFGSHNVPYGSPYLHKLERVYMGCREAGLDRYWKAETDFDAIISGTTISNVVEEKPLRKLTLQTQIIQFYILGTGLTLSSVCFAAEIYLHKREKKISMRVRSIRKL